MKYLKTYNESIRDMMAPKSEEEIEKAVQNMSAIEILRNINRGRLDKSFMPSDEKIQEYVDTLDPFDRIRQIKHLRLDDKFMPSKEDIISKMPNPDVVFKPTKDWGSGSGQGDFEASYDDLVKLFGEPEESDGYKVSMEWTLKDEEGNIVSIYDWKSTNLYDSSLPSPEEIQELDSFDWHIGARNKEDATNLIGYIYKNTL
jgi:hypothetical protein